MKLIRNFNIAKDNGFKPFEKFRKFFNFEKIDNYQHGIHDYFKFLKFDLVELLTNLVIKLEEIKFQEKRL